MVMGLEEEADNKHIYKVISEHDEEYVDKWKKKNQQCNSEWLSSLNMWTFSEDLNDIMGPVS